MLNVFFFLAAKAWNASLLHYCSLGFSSRAMGGAPSVMSQNVVEGSGPVNMTLPGRV